jgi:hypothetical protein
LTDWSRGFDRDLTFCLKKVLSTRSKDKLTLKKLKTRNELVNLKLCIKFIKYQKLSRLSMKIKQTNLEKITKALDIKTTTFWTQKTQMKTSKTQICEAKND